jgi:hypothetical protein
MNAALRLGAKQLPLLLAPPGKSAIARSIPPISQLARGGV